MLVLCYSCKGRRKVAPLGGIEKNCRYCNGTGYVDELNHAYTLDKPVSPIIKPPLNLIDNTQNEIIDVSNDPDADIDLYETDVKTALKEAIGIKRKFKDKQEEVIQC